MSKEFNCKCNKKCEYYASIGTPGHGLCKIFDNYRPVVEDENCPFVPHFDINKMTCGKDCANFGSFECLTVDEDSPIVHSGVNYKGEPWAERCAGFEDKLKYDFFAVCNTIYMRDPVLGIKKVLDELFEEWKKEHKDPRSQWSKGEECERNTNTSDNNDDTATIWD